MTHVREEGLRLLRSSLFGSLTDQVVVSLGNFTLNIFLARLLPREQFGAFAILLSVILFFNTLHQAFAIFPLSVEGAPAQKPRFRYLLAVATVVTGLGSFLALPVMAATAFGIGHPHLFLPAGLYLLAWQMQEVYRRGLLARARFGAAIALDMVRYLGPVLALAAASRLATPTLPESFAILIGFTALSALPLVSGTMRAMGAAWHGLTDELRTHWRMTAPLLLAAMLAALSVQWFPWLLALRHGLAAPAALAALFNIVGFASPVLFGMENMLVPEIARRRAVTSHTGLMAMAWRRVLACFLLLLPFFTAVLIWPKQAVHLVYGHQGDYDQYVLGLRLLALTYMLLLVSFAFAAVLRGFHASGAVFQMRLWSALVSVTIGSACVWYFGITGACIASLLAALASAVCGYYFVNRLRPLTATL